MTFPLPADFRQNSKNAPRTYFHRSTPFAPNINFTHAATPLTLSPLAEEPEDIIDSAYTTYMAPPPEGSEVAPSPTLSVSERSEINWDDPRIQSWSSPEHEENSAYLDKGVEVHETFKAYQVNEDLHLLAKKHVAKLQRMAEVTTTKGNSLDEEGDAPEQRYNFGLEKGVLMAELEGLKPKWLAAYDKGKQPIATIKPRSSAGRK